LKNHSSVGVEDKQLQTLLLQEDLADRFAEEIIKNLLANRQK
jgi:hypothetical protein